VKSEKAEKTEGKKDKDVKKDEKEKEEIKFIHSLKNINFTIPEGQLTSIIGKVGSGKSSLFYSLLNEMEKYEGKNGCKGRISYVE
jgi:ABC-type polysaccharide/polyol phosphate transport system ATPase subunit